MSQPFGLTGLSYDAGGPVPYPVYRCKATAQEKPGHTHLCRHPRDHEGDYAHACICSKIWEPVTA